GRGVRRSDGQGGAGRLGVGGQYGAGRAHSRRRQEHLRVGGRIEGVVRTLRDRGLERVQRRVVGAGPPVRIGVVRRAQGEVVVVGGHGGRRDGVDRDIGAVVEVRVRGAGGGVERAFLEDVVLNGDGRGACVVHDHAAGAAALDRVAD